VAEGTPDELTHRLKGAAALRVEVRGPAGPAFDVLKGVPGVAAIHARGDAGGVAAFEVEAESGRDVRPELARAVVQKGLDLLGLSQAGMSLEEIFLHLTTTEAAAAAAGNTPSEAPAAGQEVTP
jgi:ABC-2 type transport system ATP-binding protein